MPLVHLELHTTDLAGARAFYEQLCGWRPVPITTGAGEYVAVDVAGGVGGGMVACPGDRSLWLPYVEVPDIGRTVEHAQALGARVLLEAREGPAGWRGVVATPAGGEMAFWQSKR
jgi:uncharacterized protein